MSYFDEVEDAAAFLRGRLGDIPAIAVVLGSGLGAFADRLDDARRVPYTEIPHWPGSTVVGHAGTLVCGASAGRAVLTLAGRAHFYEGHDLRTVTFATRASAPVPSITVTLVIVSVSDWKSPNVSPNATARTASRDFMRGSLDRRPATS